MKTLQFRAALELSVQHFLLAGVAGMRRLGVLMPVERWAHQLDQVASWLNQFGSECGGMLVSVIGKAKDGRSHRIAWHLTADNNCGPEIPCMAGILIADLCVGGTFMVATSAGLQEARRLSPHDPASLMAKLTVAFAIGQILGPVCVSLAPAGATSFNTLLSISAVLLVASGFYRLSVRRAD